MADDNSTGPVNDLASLKGIYELLAAHPSFRVPQVERSPSPNRMASRLGRIIKKAYLLRFGAEFNNILTLLSFRVQREGRQRIVLDLVWHATDIPAGWSAFIHFVDQQRELRFQGDYSFEGQAPSAFGFLYLRRNVEVPREIPGGLYGVRLGVWSPAGAVHLPLTRFRGCIRESTAWCRDAVILDTVVI